MSVKSAKQAAIDNIISRIAIFGALQRNTIYKKAASAKDKKDFRDFLSAQLKKTFLATISAENYNEKDHCRTIEYFSETISGNKKFNIFLNNNILNIGTTQKLINLHWKISWLLKPRVPIPLHCPFDSIIIKKLGGEVRNIKWTTMNSMQDYKILVEAAEMARKKNNHKTIAEWELAEYGNSANYL